MFAHVCAHVEDREVPVIVQSSLEGRYSSVHEDPSNVRCDSNNSPKALPFETPHRGITGSVRVGAIASYNMRFFVCMFV